MLLAHRETCQQPLTPPSSLPPLVRSLRNNRLQAEGAKHVADMLTVNHTLTSIEYASSDPWSLFRYCQ